MISLIVLLSSLSFAAEPPMDFLSAIDAVVQRNPDVKIAQETLDGTKAKNIPARARFFPSLSLTGSYQTSDNLGVQGSKTGVEAVSEFNLFRFGADGANLRAARAQEASQEMNVQAVILKTQSEAAQTIFSYIQSQNEVALLKRLAQNREEAAQIASQRYKKGLLAAQESQKAAIDRDNTIAELRDAEAGLASSAAQVKNLLGHSSISDELPWKKDLSTFTPKLLALDEKELGTRPDVRSAEEERRMAEEKTNETLGRVLPSLDLSLGYGVFKYQGGDSSGFTGPEWRASLALSVPLFDHLQNYSGYRASVHAKSAADWQFEKAKRNALSDWEGAKENLAVNLKTALQREETLQVSRQIYRDNQKRFESGLSSANELSLDFQRLLETEKLVIRGWTQAHLSFVRLCSAVGRQLRACVE